MLHTQEVRGSSPCAPTNPLGRSSKINNIELGSGAIRQGDPLPNNAGGSDSETILRPKLSAYFCNVAGSPECWGFLVHALSAGKAKNLYLRNLLDAWPGVAKYTEIRAKRLGEPRDTDKFKHTAKYRGVDFHIGSFVQVCESRGFVADSNSSANFSVHITEGPWAGRIISAHPSEIKIITTGGPDGQDKQNSDSAAGHQHSG